MNFNLVLMGGHMTRDIETSFTPNQVQVAKGGIAVNKKYKDTQRVCFLDFVAFGKTAEFLVKYFSKGSPVLLQGELQLDTWEKDGQKRSKHELLVDRVSFTAPKDESAADTTPF